MKDKKLSTVCVKTNEMEQMMMPGNSQRSDREYFVRKLMEASEPSDERIKRMAEQLRIFAGWGSGMEDSCERFIRDLFKETKEEKR